jgi:hypothetical protein
MTKRPRFLPGAGPWLHSGIKLLTRGKTWTIIVSKSVGIPGKQLPTQFFENLN